MSKPALPGALLLPALLLAIQCTKAQPVPASGNAGKIQLAILLDVSNSMDGLIRQAKDQLWNTVMLFGKLRCEQKPVDFEIALYEYGRADNDKATGYVRLISPFSRDLDWLYQKLNDLTTNGGEEYCGQVIQTSITDLSWDKSGTTYKTIFIAGNESFLQGPADAGTACKLAAEKGVIVNTIYCGSKEQGVRLYWDRGIQCGNGSFNWIDQDAKEFSVPTPYDEQLVYLKSKFNETMVPYGKDGAAMYERMMEYDTLPMSNVDNPNMITKYIVVKTDPLLNNNSGWDLVEALKKDSLILEKTDRNTLMPFLREKSIPELKQYVLLQSGIRDKIRREILENEKRKSAFIEEARRKAGITAEENTLQLQLQKTITEQASRYNIKPEG